MWFDCYSPSKFKGIRFVSSNMYRQLNTNEKNPYSIGGYNKPLHVYEKYEVIILKLTPLYSTKQSIKKQTKTSMNKQQPLNYRLLTQ